MLRNRLHFHSRTVGGNRKLPWADTHSIKLIDMDIKTHILDVKDGDAIILELSKEDEDLIMVIDGGKSSYYQEKLKPKLNDILTTYNKKAPDIVVCTHYDSDHIGGLIPLIEDYISDIKEVWIHKTPNLINSYIDKSNHLLEQKNKHLGDYEWSKFTRLFESSEHQLKQTLDENAISLIESLPQLKRIIDLIPASKLKQVYHKQKPLSDWQEIIVLGPTKNYYNSLFPSFKTFETFIKEEVNGMLLSSRATFRQLELAGISACDQLKEESETRLTSTNKASIIIAIDKIGKRYLFTGDAGIESFKSIPNYQEELKDLFFLKVPHHASDNNLSKELIELMNPIYAYSSGDKHQDDSILKCISLKNRNIETKSTKSAGDLIFNK